MKKKIIISFTHKTSMLILK